MEKYNGNYRFEYNGPQGSGHGTLEIKDGIIGGKDYTQATYTGIARIEDGQLVINVTIDFSGLPGTYSVISGNTGKIRHTLEFPLPLDFLPEHKTTVNTVHGPLSIHVTKV